MQYRRPRRIRRYDCIERKDALTYRYENTFSIGILPNGSVLKGFETGFADDLSSECHLNPLGISISRTTFFTGRLSQSFLGRRRRAPDSVYLSVGGQCSRMTPLRDCRFISYRDRRISLDVLVRKIHFDDQIRIN